MKLIYPELDNYEELHELTNRELRMCWTIGCPSSPLKRRIKDKSELVKEAVTSCFDDNQVENSEDLQNLLGGTMPEKYGLAIRRFAMFDISARLRIYFMTQAQLDVMEAMSYVPEEAMETMQSAEFKEYAASVKSMQGQMQEMLGIIEGSFGLDIKVPLDENMDFKVVASLDEVG